LGIFEDVPDYFAGYNKINGTNYNLIAENYSGVMAEMNWWGDDEPNPDKFIEGEESYIDFKPYLSEPPFLKFDKVKYVGNTSNYRQDLLSLDPTSSLLQKLRYAKRLVLKRDFKNARNICMELVQSSPDSSASILAINILLSTIIDNNSAFLVKNLLKKISNTSKNKNLCSFTKLTLADLEKENYIEKLNEIIDNFPTSKFIPLIFFKKFNYYYFKEYDISMATQISNQMSLFFPSSTLTKETKILLGEPDNRLIKTNLIKDNNISITNYPNPFNPVTKIKYSISTPLNPPFTQKEETGGTSVSSVGQLVTIKVFDILGREVATMVNEPKKAGEYEIEFDASKYGLTSGVYLYQLRSNGYTQTKKFVYLR